MTNIIKEFGKSLQDAVDKKNASERELIESHKEHAAAVRAQYPPSRLKEGAAWALVERLGCADDKSAELLRDKIGGVIGSAIRSEIGCEDKENKYWHWGQGVAIWVNYFHGKWHLFIEDHTPRREYDPITEKDKVETLQSLQTKVLIRHLSKTLKRKRDQVVDNMPGGDDTLIHCNMQGAHFTAPTLRELIVGINKVLAADPLSTGHKIDPATIHPELSGLRAEKSRDR